MSKIEELTARHAATTAGKWGAYGKDDPMNYMKVVAVSEDGRTTTTRFVAYTDGNDAEFVALAHTLTPGLIGAAKALQEIAALARAAVESDGKVFMSETDVLTLADDALEALEALQ